MEKVFISLVNAVISGTLLWSCCGFAGHDHPHRCNHCWCAVECQLRAIVACEGDWPGTGQQQVALIAQVKYILTKKSFNKTRPDKIENIWEVHWTGIHGEGKE